MGAWVGAALTGLGALGGLFGLGKQSNTAKVDNTTTSTPTYDPTNQSFRDALIAKYMDLVNGAGSKDFQNAYTTGGLKNINTATNASNLNIENMLTSRGIDRTTAGGTATGMVGLNNANKSADFLNSVPLIMDQRFQDILKQAGGYQAALPVGTTQHQTGTVATVGGPQTGIPGVVGGAASGLATWLGQLSAQNSFSKALKSFGSAGSPGSGGAWDYQQG